MDKALRLALVLLICSALQAQNVAVLGGGVTSMATADFNSRSGGATIPAKEFCTNVSSLGATNPLSDIASAGIKCGRVFVNVNQCTAFNTCSWTNTGGQLTLLQNAGFTKVLAVMYLTSPDNETGSGGLCSPPSSPANWATSIQNFLTYANTNFPGLVQEIELDNEPDGGTVNGTYPSTPNWCPPTGHTNLGDYLTTIHTAGPQIHTAFPSIKIGIPALASPASNASTWFNASTGVLNSTTGWTSPDFISYHLYLGDQASWALQWAQIQGASGINNWLTTIQTDAGAIPVQITETSTSSSFAASCCRNDPTFSPMYFSLLQIDYLNATTIPGGVFHYTDQSGATPGYFCLEGNLDAGMDCSNSTFSRYPQYYAYNLFNNSLNLAAGGNAATSVSPGVSSTSISCAAFYTSSGGDVIVCTNPTTTAYGLASFTFTNAGTLTGTGTVYTLFNSALSTTAPTSNSAPISVTKAGTTYTVIAGFPALSTVAIQIT